MWLSHDFNDQFHYPVSYLKVSLCCFRELFFVTVTSALLIRDLKVCLDFSKAAL